MKESVGQKLGGESLAKTALRCRSGRSLRRWSASGSAIVADNPSGIRIDIAMRSPARVDNSVQQKKTRAVFILLGIEDNLPVAAVRVRARVGGLNGSRSAELLRAAGQIERVQPLIIIAATILTHSDKVNAAVRTGAQVYQRRSGDADLGSDLAAVPGVGGCLSGFEQRDLPADVSGVNAIVFHGRKDYVVHAVPGMLKPD